MNECSISARKLEKEQKLFKIKEKQFKKIENINVLMETHANKMKQFESEKKDHLEEVEEKKRYYQELDAHYKSMRKELDEEWDLKAANEKWRNDLLEWRGKITQEYEEKAKHNHAEKEAIRAMKEEFENERLVFSKECMKKQLEIDARKDDYASKLRALKETEDALEERRKSIGLQERKWLKCKINMKTK